MANSLTKVEKDVWQAARIVEKPDPKNAPSNVAIMSGYILPKSSPPKITNLDAEKSCGSQTPLRV